MPLLLIKGLVWIISCLQTLRDCEESCLQHQSNSGDSLPASTTNCIEKLQDEYETSMSDDLHTSVALAAISEPLKVMNDLMHTRKVIFNDKLAEILFSAIHYSEGVLIALFLCKR